jgi:CheY-like chemotaxis protein
VTVSILVVDDEPDVAELFRQRFRRETRQGTYVLHYAASGHEALERLSAEIQPELVAVLSDINMPGMDGLQLLAEIKQRRPDLTVMMVTAYGDDERRRCGRARSGRVPDEARGFRAPEGAAKSITYCGGLTTHPDTAGPIGRHRSRPQEAHGGLARIDPSDSQSE